MRLIVLLILALALCACQPEKPGCARLPNGGNYCLQRGGPHFSTLQQSVLSAGEQKMTLLTRIENDANGLRFAGITPLGHTLISVSWENDELRADLPPALALRLDPAFLPALTQIALWPAEQVRAGLSPELELVEKDNGRQLRREGEPAELVLDISWEGKLPYQRLRIASPAGFRIDARTIDNGETE